MSQTSIPRTMKALVLSGRGFENVRIQTVPVPKPGPNQLLARVDAAGVCTSILKIIAQGKEHKYLTGWDPAKWPIHLGDEGSLTLVQIGENLTGQYKVGDRYGIQPAVDVGPINHLHRYNNNGRGMDKTAVGYTLGGQLAQYLLIQEEVLKGNCLIPLPDENMPYFAVSMAEPISCVVSAQTRQIHFYKECMAAMRYPKSGIKKGGTCVVLGAGGMGKIHVELAIRYQPKCLIVSEPIDERRQWVDRVLTPKARDNKVELITTIPEQVEQVIRKKSDGKMADDIILAVGIREVQQKALNWLGRGGVANAFGGLKKGDSILNVDAIPIHYEEVKIVGSSGGDPADYLETLWAIQKGDIDPGNYVVGVGSLDQAVNVLKMIQNNQVQGKVILYPHIPYMDIRKVTYWSKEDEQQLLKMGS